MGKLLGFTENDIQILMGVGKLTPLGDPAPNAPKWFAAVAMVRLAADEDWLHRTTKEIAKHWRNKLKRRTNRPHCYVIHQRFRLPHCNILGLTALSE